MNLCSVRTRIAVWAIHLAAISVLSNPRVSQAQDCKCFLYKCDASNTVVKDFTSPHPFQVLVGSDDTVENGNVVSRDYDVRLGLFINASDALRVQEALGIKAKLDTLGDGKVVLQLNYSHLERQAYVTGPCAGKQSKIYKLVFPVFVGDGRDVGGSPNPFGLDPLQAIVPGGWVDAPVTTESLVDYQPDAQIDVQMRESVAAGVRVLEYTGKFSSADGTSKANLKFRYEGDLPFQDNSVDLKLFNVPLHVARGVIYCNNYRDIAFLPANDPKLTAQLNLPNRGLCLPGLKQKNGKPLCITPDQDANGNAVISEVRVYRYAGLECAPYELSPAARPGAQQVPPVLPDVPLNFLP